MNKIRIKTKHAFLIAAAAIVVSGMAFIFISQYIYKPDTHSSNNETLPEATIMINPQTPTAVVHTATPAPPEETPTQKPLREPEVTATSIQKEQTEPTDKPTPLPKPEPQGEATDKDKKPVYNEKDTKPKQSQPKNGDKNSEGQIYVEGFGWIKDEGGGGKGTEVDSDGDVNKQIGSMD